MQVDEYKRRLQDAIINDIGKYPNNNEYCKRKMDEYMVGIIKTAKTVIELPIEKINEHDLASMKNNLELALKKVQYIKKNYDVINLIKSGELDGEVK